MKRLMVLILASIPVAGAADVVVPADKVRDSVNIRLEADAGSDIVGKLSVGESLPLVSSVDGWHEVRLEGDATGFISADWTRVVGDSPVEAAAEIVEDVVAEAPAPEPEAVVEEEPEPEPEPAIEEEPVPEPEPVVTPPAPAAIELTADRDFVVKLRKPGELGNSQIFDDGNRVGIATRDPQQRLEVNGSIRIHDQNSNVAGLMITQASGDTGYIMHNRASTLTIGAGSIDRITIDRDGNVGVGVSRPEYPLQMANGAYVSAGGVWTNRSSRNDKENIAQLPAEDALAAVMALEPVSFNYRSERGEDYVGFIAEDVPDLLAAGAGDSLSPMDIVAALTKVVQEQQRRIDDLEARLTER